MQYLIQTKTAEEVNNFLFDEKGAVKFLTMAASHLESVAMFKIGFGNVKQLFVRMMAKKEHGGYVEDWYGNLEFNFGEQWLS